MATFTDDERDCLVEMKSITTDANGREVLAGLTEEETEFYMECVRCGQRPGDPSARARYDDLEIRHQLARASIFAAQNRARSH